MVLLLRDRNVTRIIFGSVVDEFEIRTNYNSKEKYK